MMGFPGGSAVKNPPAMQELQQTKVGSLGWEDPLEEGMTTHASILAWRIPWTKEPGRLQSRGLEKVRHKWGDWALMQSRLKDGSKRFENIETCYFRNISTSLVVKSATAYGKYLPSLIWTVVMLGGPFWPLQATYPKFACTLFNPFTRCLKRLLLLMAIYLEILWNKISNDAQRVCGKADKELWKGITKQMPRS